MSQDMYNGILYSKCLYHQVCRTHINELFLNSIIIAVITYIFIIVLWYVDS